MRQEDKDFIIEHLTRLTRPECLDVTTGICGNLSAWASRLDRHMRTLEIGRKVDSILLPWMYAQYSAWPKWSGCLIYPIPHHCSPYIGFRSAMMRKNLWDRNNPYCQQRFELLEFLINRAHAIGVIENA